MFKINDLVLVNGYVCIIQDIYNDKYYLQQIDGSDVVVKENQLYKYLGKLCLTTFQKERARNIRNNRIYKMSLITVFIVLVLLTNVLVQNY